MLHQTNCLHCHPSLDHPRRGMGHSGLDLYFLMYYRPGKISWKTEACVEFYHSWHEEVLVDMEGYVLIHVAGCEVGCRSSKSCLNQRPKNTITQILNLANLIVFSSFKQLS